jgi:ElaB/YqjD/DUF883 family membrane-anchored ribosome-binding protein
MGNECEVIRKQMQETRAAMNDKIEALEHRVVATVHAASTAVSETVGDVKVIVQETVASAKDIFDLPRQVEREPWAMLAGATALGYLGGYLLSRFRAGAPRTSDKSGSLSPALDSPGPAEKPSWLAGVRDTFQDEISQFEKLALGRLCAVLRDVVTEAVPTSMERQMGDIMDGITVKLGGQPLEERVPFEPSRGEGNGTPGKSTACD